MRMEAERKAKFLKECGRVSVPRRAFSIAPASYLAMFKQTTPPCSFDRGKNRCKLGPFITNKAVWLASTRGKACRAIRRSNASSGTSRARRCAAHADAKEQSLGELPDQDAAY